MASESTSRPFPGFSSIFDFGVTGSERPFHADLDLATSEQALGITRGEITLPAPVQARWAMGSKRPSDLIGTTLAIPLLVSERLLTILRDAGFTGWSTYEIHLVGRDGTPIPGYHGFSVYGRCGLIDESKAVEVPQIFPGGVFPVRKGLFFDPNTWDGSDFFMPENNWGSIFVIEDVKRAIEKAKIKNVQFKSLIHCRVHT